MSTADARPADGPGPVVVGFDGSPESAAAFAFALDEAARRGARLPVVTAVRVPEYWNTAYRHGAPPPPADMVESIRKGARETTQHAVDEVVAAGGAGAAAVPVTVDVITGVPAEVLLEAARDASILGARAPGPPAGRECGAGIGRVAVRSARVRPCDDRAARDGSGHREDPGLSPSLSRAAPMRTAGGR